VQQFKTPLSHDEAFADRDDLPEFDYIGLYGIWELDLGREPRGNCRFRPPQASSKKRPDGDAGRGSGCVRLCTA
jgi:hypothetical protein